MNIWFDSASFEDHSIREELRLEGISENDRIIREIVLTEAKAIGLDKIFLDGLSEGCTMAIYSLINLEQEEKHLAGFIGLSGWPPFQNQTDQILSGDQGLDMGDDGSFF